MKLKQESVFYSDSFSRKFYDEIFEISSIYIIRVICYMYSCMRACMSACVRVYIRKNGT